MNENPEKKSRALPAVLAALLICVFIVQCLFWAGLFRRETAVRELNLVEATAEEQPAEEEAPAPAEAEDIEPASLNSVPEGDLSREGYELEQVLVFSRHNIRSPLNSPDSTLYRMTPHGWFQWTGGVGELSLRGGILETNMGHFFRKWLESEGLFPENYHPEKGAVRVYANAKQRTIATAQYFTAGLMPTANMDIETHVKFNNTDPVFTPKLTFISPEYVSAVEDQVSEIFGAKIEGLADNYDLLAEVIDMEESEAWKDGSIGPLKRTDDTGLRLELDKEPGIRGSLWAICSAGDAMVLQYYEEPDDLKAAFGHELTFEQWKQIAEIKSTCIEIAYGTPLLAINGAHPLLQEIESELGTEGRRFTFLCGHDANVAGLLSALKAEEYELPGSIEPKTPIGCKLVFCRWRAEDGSSWISVDMVYQTAEQMRSTPVLDLEVHPAIVPLSFEGLAANTDGLYPEDDFMVRLADSIAAYDELPEKYTAADAAA